MTKEQKALVVKLRNQGMTFAAIAEKLNISVNSVKSFYRRNGNASNTLNIPNNSSYTSFVLLGNVDHKVKDSHRRLGVKLRSDRLRIATFLRQRTALMRSRGKL